MAVLDLKHGWKKYYIGFIGGGETRQFCVCDSVQNNPRIKIIQ